MGLTVLDRVLRAWLDEAILISDFLPRWMRTAAFRDLTHQWFWDGQEHVDPAKEATPRRRGCRTTRPPWPTNTPSRAATGRASSASGPRKSPLMNELGLPVVAAGGKARRGRFEPDDADEQEQVMMKLPNEKQPKSS